MKLKHILLITPLCVIAIIAYLSFKETEKKTAPAQQNSAKKDTKSAELKDVRYSKTVKDFTEFEILAKSVEYSKEENSSSFEKVNAHFYTKEGEDYHLTGDSGVYNTAEEGIIIKGDVVLKTKSGYELKTDSLLYSNKDKIISTQDSVKVQKNNMTLQGIGMVLDLQKEHLIIKQNVIAHIAGS